VLAGLTFGVSNAFANPSIGCGCLVVLRDGTTVVPYNFPQLEHEEITLTESGNINANCKLDLKSGAQTTLDFENTGFTCSLAGASGIAPNTDWQEVISANGQTTLECHFH
jgi:hypothetical protein